jgi:WD40 repeat protein
LHHLHLFLILGAFSIMPIAAGCGGGGGGGTQQTLPPTPTPDFTIALNPVSATIGIGSSTGVSVSVSAVNGFSSPVAVEVSGQSAGVSATPQAFTLNAGTPKTVTIAAAANATPGTVTLTFTGTSNSLTHSATLAVLTTTGSATLSTRTKYIRTDAVTEYGFVLNQHWEVYHAPTSRDFVTDPDSSHIYVFDSATETQMATLSVPGAFGIDETPDQSTLYVGTLTGDVYTVDPVGLKVTHRYVASQIGPYGFQAAVAMPLYDGRVALLQEQHGIANVDGSSGFAIWNPVTNAISVYASNYGAASFTQPVNGVCGPLGDIGGFTLTADRMKVLVGSIDSDSTLCEVDATSGQDNYIAAAGSPRPITVSPDGLYIAIAGLGQKAYLYDPNTLSLIGTIGLSPIPGTSPYLVFSSDSKTLFDAGGSIVFAYSVPGGQLTAWMSNIVVEQLAGGYAPDPVTTPSVTLEDGNGLLIGPLEEGFGFLDTAAFHTGTVGAALANAVLNPDTGPTTGGTQISGIPAKASNVYFGANASPSVSTNGSGTVVTTPPGQRGPVPVYTFISDGGVQLAPDAFSYGPTILQVTPDMSNASGGGAGLIYGYGFGPTGNGPASPGLTVTVGGTPATITGFNSNAYGLEVVPYPLQAIYFTIPAGTTGNSADVSVATNAGSTVSHNAMTYLANPPQYSLPGSSLAQGVYDPVRDVYYFTDTNVIRVFSLSQGVWLTPINVPAPARSTPRLWGIALSPDHSKLAVSDLGANVMYVINLGNSVTLTFPLSPGFPQGVAAHPAGIAISDSGVIYVAADVEGGSGYRAFFKLDTNTNTLTTYPVDGPDEHIDGTPEDVYLRAAISSDNTTVYFNADGEVFSIDAATDAISNASSEQGCCSGNYEMTLAANQTSFSATGYLYDSDLNAAAFQAMNDRESLDVTDVYGIKLSPDGSLLYQPTTNRLDIFDGQVGNLLHRIALPFALSANDDALVSDGKDNVLIAITGAAGDGIAVLDLSSIAEPSPLPYAISSNADPRSGTRRLLGQSSAQTRSSRPNTPASGARPVSHAMRPSITITGGPTF